MNTVKLQKYSLILIFVMLLTTSCKNNNSDQTNFNGTIKNQNIIINELESKVRLLEDELLNSNNELSIVSERLDSMVEDASSVDNLSIRIFLQTLSMYSNNYFITGMPILYSKVLANHIFLDVYSPMTEQDAIPYIENLERYKTISEVQIPYIYGILDKSVVITVNTTLGREELEVDEILLLIESENKPVLIVKVEDKYVGYVLTDSSKYDFNILFQENIKNHHEIIELFRDW